jgi:hypothetical protein
MKGDFEKYISEIQKNFQNDINYKFTPEVESYYLKHLVIHPDYFCKKK